MAKLIQTIVDAEGNVHVDLSGFAGNECVHEDRRFAEDLAQLGLTQLVDSRTSKTLRSVASQEGQTLPSSLTR